MAVVPAKAADDALSVDLRASRSEIHVAEPMWLTLSATAPAGWQIRLPEVPEAFQELRVSSAVAQHYTLTSGSRGAVLRLQVESLSPGRYRVGPLEVGFVPPSGTSQEAAEGSPTGDDALSEPQELRRSTGAITVRVQSALGLFDSRRLRDINGQVRPPWGWPQWMLAAAVVLAAAAIARRVRQWLVRRGGSVAARQRRLSRALDQLDEARLEGSLSTDLLIVSLADIVRQSLRLQEERRPRHRTTDEWIAYVGGRDAAHRDEAWAESDGNAAPASDSADLGQAVARVLRTADAIKFAGQPVTLDDARSCLAAAKTVVLREVDGSRAAAAGERRA